MWIKLNLKYTNVYVFKLLPNSDTCSLESGPCQKWFDSKMCISGRQGNEERSSNGVGYDVHVCMRLVQPYIRRYHHLVTDNYFTSPALCEALFSSQTYMTGTVRVYRKGMPRSFRGLRLREGEREVRQSGNMMAMGYGDRKTVTFLSSLGSPA